jgi:3-oxoacyl-[acyl-carrier protein] reductase
MRLSGKTALVTGSSRGVGKAIAVAFAREGARVMVNYTSNEKAAMEVVEEIQKLGGQAQAFKADVAKKADAEAIVQATVDAFGGIDILVNNAGLPVPP